MIRPLICVLAPCLVLASCGTFGDGKKKANPRDQPGLSPSAIPAELRKKVPEGSAITPGGNVKMTAAITPDSDIVFTDPDNPDAPLPELSTLLTSEKKGPWEQSETLARRRASREGKPLLIWFTDSGPSGSAMSKALADELFAKPEFEQWATDKLVRLRVDANARIKRDDLDEQTDMESRIKDYVTTMKERYKVVGQPTLVVLNPSGELVGKYVGYKRGQADFTWGQLKQAEIVASTAYQSWRKGLEKKGYREWQDTKGRKVFAKLVNYHDGELILIEPDGTRSKTKEGRLSDADRGWINQEKARRGIR
jgi:thioredoxin-related protein